MSMISAFGARKAMHAVSGRLNCCPSFVKDAFVSPRPCSRMRMLVGGCEVGAAHVSELAGNDAWLEHKRGTMSRVTSEGKSGLVGRRPGMVAAATGSL
jgi:hypothetical protein